MELRDIYDIDRIPQDRTSVRGEPIKPGDYIMVVHACIFNSAGQMLIQRRHSSKKAWGGYWDVSVGGAAMAGETSREAMQRELKEELGVDIDFSGRRPAMTMNFERGFDDFYLLHADLELDGLRLQSDEVSAVRWADRDELLAMIDRGEFIPFFKSMIELLFDTRNKPDCLNI